VKERSLVNEFCSLVDEAKWNGQIVDDRKIFLTGPRSREENTTFLYFRAKALRGLIKEPQPKWASLKEVKAERVALLGDIGQAIKKGKKIFAVTIPVIKLEYNPAQLGRLRDHFRAERQKLKSLS
jgi:hypothetical protein